MTYDGSSTAAGVKMYGDGVSMSTTISDDNLSSTILNSSDMLVGGGEAGPSDFPGNIDDVRVYNRVLSATEVAALYGCTNPAGQEGDLIYNGAKNVLQYCDGPNWIAIGNPN